MESSVNIVSNFSDKIIENPEVEDTRCRICYEQTKPLITLCECSGTIAYVHQECILDWITKKMEVSDTVEIPKCEICRVTYSAKLKIGRKKICFKALFKKVRQLKFIQIFTSLFYLLGTIVAFYLLSKMVFFLFVMLFTSLKTQEEPNQIKDNLFVSLLTMIVFPIYYVKAAIDHSKKRMKLWQESMVQIVELTLNPKITIKQ